MSILINDHNRLNPGYQHHRLAILKYWLINLTVEFIIGGGIRKQFP